jgi:hypothetical protein
LAVVFLPTPLRKRFEGRQSVDVPGGTLREIVEGLERLSPGVRELLVDPELEGRVNRSYSAIVDGEAADLGLRTTVGKDSEVHFIPAIAGG